MTVLEPGVHFKTVALHANRSVFATPFVKDVVDDFKVAAHFVNCRGQHIFAEFLRLVLGRSWAADLGGHPVLGSPFAVPAVVWARLRTFHRRCFSVANPASKLYRSTSAVGLV
ncbi:MAG: hypothetical protein ACK5N0_14105, partial [Synechococcaceae cyanobacterium]